MAFAVEFHHVSKKFTLHHARATSFQEAVVNFFRRRRRRRASGELWVLRDVSFRLEQGKTVGLIGVNGAGKSTALKLMARIIEPTSGRVTVHGNLRALLELGAGFHPDLTGRENIYLNAAILGLSREETRRSLDAIVAFAELEDFIDVPVKHYSSGMYVRLGFAVAVHTAPEVLLVDEVLSVGDAAFQGKCMERIAELRRDGVTIVLVSHNLEVVQSLCDEAIWFEKGEVRAWGKPVDVVMAYMRQVARRERERAEAEAEAAEEEAAPAAEAEATAQAEAPPEVRHRWGSGEVEITRVELCDADGQPTTTFETGDAMVVRLHYRAARRVAFPVFGLAIHHQNGAHICGPNTRFGGLEIPYVEGEGVVAYHIPSLPLLEGGYRLSVAVVNRTLGETYDYHDRLYPFRVFRGACRERYGLITLGGSWTHDVVRNT